MGGSITGTRLSELYQHGRGDVTVTLDRAGYGSFQIFGFSDDDDAIQARQTDDTISMITGLYGGAVANINPSRLGEVILKLQETHPDNIRMGRWHAEVQAGLVTPGTIIISGALNRHTAKFCLPRRPGEPVPASKEVSAIEWSILVGDISLWEPIARSPIELTLGVTVNI